MTLIAVSPPVSRAAPVDGATSLDVAIQRMSSRIVAPRALEPDVTAALAYLVAQQQGDGSFDRPNPLTTSFHTTARVADALRAIPEGNAVAGAAASFVGAALRCRRSNSAADGLLLSTSPTDVTEILAGQNGDGGFGADVGFASNVLDTSLADSRVARGRPADRFRRRGSSGGCRQFRDGHGRGAGATPPSSTS